MVRRQRPGWVLTSRSAELNTCARTRPGTQGRTHARAHRERRWRWWGGGSRAAAARTEHPALDQSGRVGGRDGRQPRDAARHLLACRRPEQRVRDRGSERERETEKETERQRQRDGETERQRDRERKKREEERKRERHKDRETERHKKETKQETERQ